MITTTFGRVTGLRVSEYALGTGSFGQALRHGATLKESRSILDRFSEAGGIFLDTADNYQLGESEEILGQLLGNDRENFVIASKYGRGAGQDPPVSVSGNSRRAMMRSVEQSLRRLKTDRIDVYWAHYSDGVTPIDEILLAFDDLASSGKIMYGGLSNFPAWRVARGQTLAEVRGLTSLAGIQVEHSLVERSAERDLLPMAEAFGLGAALYSPLGGGLLTGKYRQGGTGRPVVVYEEDSPRRTSAIDAVQRVASALGVTPGQIAVAWQRRVSNVARTPMVTVIGPRTLDQLEDYLGALEVSLTDDDVALLDQATAIESGVPYDSIGGPPDLGDPDRLAPPIVPVV